MAQSPARLLWICLPLAFPATLGAQFTVQLAPRTDRQFIEYQQAAETKMDWQAHLSPAPGDVLIAAGAEAAVTGVPGGMIHDWRAATIVPGATVAQALAVLQDYANYKRIYAPEIADSKLLSHEGNTYRAYLRLIQKKILTVILDSEYEVEYRPLGNGRESQPLGDPVPLDQVCRSEQRPGTAARNGPRVPVALEFLLADRAARRGRLSGVPHNFAVPRHPGGLRMDHQADGDERAARIAARPDERDRACTDGPPCPSLAGGTFHPIKP
jgi:hypothetical protein